MWKISLLSQNKMCKHFLFGRNDDNMKTIHNLCHLISTISLQTITIIYIKPTMNIRGSLIYMECLHMDYIVHPLQYLSNDSKKYEYPIMRHLGCRFSFPMN